jgi:hypothetical protein
VPKPHVAQTYGGGTNLPSGQGTYENNNPITVPPVPSGTGTNSHGTSVDTTPMDLFAENIGRLISPTSSASTVLQAVSVQPGAFYHANQMRITVNGPNADDGLKEKYIQTLSDLGQGLADLQLGIQQLSAKYKTIEDANTMTATDFQTAMASSQGDFTQMMTDAGGSGGSGSGGSGS